MKRIPLILIIVAIILGIWYIINSTFSSKTKRIVINNQVVKVEIADTDEKRTKGLSGRVSLTKDQGMLFIFPTTGGYSFWMKDMRFPLDFIWINGDTIVDLTENVPYPAVGTPDSQLPMYSAVVPVNKVLEVNAGTIKSLNIQVGDRFRF